MELYLMKFHLMKLHSVNCCFRTFIKPERNIIFFQIPMKIKTLLMLMLVMKNMANNTMYIVQKLRAFLFNGIAFNEFAFKVSY